MKLKDKKISKELKEYIRKYTSAEERVMTCNEHGVKFNYLEMHILTFKAKISAKSEPLIIALTKLAIANREKDVNFSSIITRELQESI